jgi:hypothetical protein
MQLPEWWRQKCIRNLITIINEYQAKLYNGGPHFFFLSPRFSGYPKREGGGGMGALQEGSFNFFPLERWEEGQRYIY